MMAIKILAGSALSNLTEDAVQLHMYLGVRCHALL